MTPTLPPFKEPVTLLGGGEVNKDVLSQALHIAPKIVGADGGANVARAHGKSPEWVVGDLDSIDRQILADMDPARVLFVAEQETTDFEKCLMRIEAPFILGLGFTGPRFDHTLAAWNALAKYPDRACLLLGQKDLAFLAPPRLHLALAPDTRVSIFPLNPLRGRSRGLRWPIDGLELSPLGRIGTSNTAQGPVDLEFDSSGALLILPRSTLPVAIDALRPGWRN
jgi:thiamine pyrophosphokinase